jgi:hypothetical protein
MSSFKYLTDMFARCDRCGRVGWGMRPTCRDLGLAGFECRDHRACAERKEERGDE